METLEKLKKEAHEKECANEYPKCEFCKDTGFIETTEWVGTDDSYDAQALCVCTED